MRRTLTLLVSLAALVLAAACKPEAAGEGAGAVFYAVIEESRESKVYMDAERRVFWNAGDKVSIFNGTTENQEYNFMGQTGDKSGRLEKAGSGSSVAGSPADGVWAVYPYSEQTSLNGSTVTLELPATQDYTAGSFAAGVNVMVAHSTDNNLSFKNLCGILTLRLYGSSSISSISLKGRNGELLAGTAQVSFKDGDPVCSMVSGNSGKEVTLVCDAPVQTGAGAGEATEFIFVLPPVTFSKGISILATDKEGRSYEAATESAIEIKRSGIVKMAPLMAELSKPTQAILGSPLPAWKQGYLDIHSINGGRGEAFYYIFPDGTTMLVDAAGAPPNEYGYDSGIPSKPSASVSCGQVIVNYIRHFAPVISSGWIDYFMASHYHGDHIGAWRDNYSKFYWQPVDKDGNSMSYVNLATGGFLLNGLPDVGMSIPIRIVIDRGDWANRPSVDYNDDGGKRRYANYINFLDWSARNYGTERKALAIGHTDQIVPLHDAAAYSNFSVRGIAAGGDIWTGSGTGVNTSYVPSAAECLANLEEWSINENIFSCVFHMSYGKFDWFAGGDIQFTGKSTYSWKDIELPISKVMKKVEAMKASHHSTKNTNSTELLGVLKPDVYIAAVWQDVQPNPATIKRVLTASPSVKIFTTNLADSNVQTLTGEGVDMSKFVSTSGHVVIRVLPGGNSYYVYVLDDSDLEYKVKAIFGPYACK